MTNCLACGATLVPDGPESTTYQFDNALWIGFHGGYGMFVDNMDATMTLNNVIGPMQRGEPPWLQHADGTPKLDADGKLIDNPDYVPVYAEERVLPGQPDYEAVICHECAHELAERIPWIGRLISPETSHAHRTAYHEAHPDHDGWDYRRQADGPDPAS